MSFITPSGWTRRQGFPQITGSGQGISLSDEFYASYDLTGIYNVMPQFDSLYDQESVVPDLAELRLSEYKVLPSADKSQAFITLTYQPSEAASATEEGVEDMYLEANTIELPLEKNADYRVKWNYDLYGFRTPDDSQPSVPGFFDTDTRANYIAGTNADGLPASGGSSWLWTKDEPKGNIDTADGLETGFWALVARRTKPEAETFIFPAPVIQERKHYRSKLSAATAASKVGTRLTPSETFGKSGGEWLVTSATVQKDGRRYLVERSFQYADDWDDDIYDAG